MLEAPAVAEPAAVETLCRLASDPARVEAMHGLLGEFCHLIRNRLNSLQIGIYLARGSDPTNTRARWDDLETHYREAERVVELFHTICRPMPLRPITIGLDLMLADFTSRWTPRFAAQRIELKVATIVPDEPSRIDPTRMAQGLDALASWRLARARPGSVVNLGGRASQGWSRIEWVERAAAPNEEGRALPIAVLARVASAHGGRLTQEERGGLHLRVDWPHVAAPVPA